MLTAHNSEKVSDFQAILIILVVTIGFSAVGASTGTADDRSFLRKSILRNYHQNIIPDNVTVKMGLSLIRFDAKPKLNRLDFFTWMRYLWEDKRLMWNEADYGGVGVLRVPIHDIWKPDIVLYNSYDIDQTCSPTNALIYPNGEVIWVPKCTFQANCDMEKFRKNPSAMQICSLIFGSRTYDGNLLRLDVYNNMNQVDMDDLWDTSDWRSLEAPAYLVVTPLPESKLDYKMDYQITFDNKKEGMKSFRGSSMVFEPNDF